MQTSLRSKYLKEFVEEIKYHNRNPQDLKALELLSDFATNPEILLDQNSKLYRARIIKDKNDINKVAGYYGFSEKESFVPPYKKARDMRANYRYIPYLYCANDAYLSLVEVRPRLEADVSIATIYIKEELRLLDFTNKKTPSKMTQTKKNLFSDLSELFSKPITDEEDTLDYIPTQFIAEYVKNKGYDGIVYKSSLTPEINKAALEKYNTVIFNYEKCFVKKSNVFRISGNYFECIQTDADKERMRIKTIFEETLNKI